MSVTNKTATFVTEAFLPPFVIKYPRIDTGKTKAIKQGKMAISTTGMDLEDTMPSEISQTKTNILYEISYM